MEFYGYMPTARRLRAWYEELMRAQAGCCSTAFAYDRGDDMNYFVCMGWTGGDGYEPAFVKAKIGRQSPRAAMRCDLDLDFETPFDRETGEVDDAAEMRVGATPEDAGAVDWMAMAKRLRREMRRVAEVYGTKEGGNG